MRHELHTIDELFLERHDGHDGHVALEDASAGLPAGTAMTAGGTARGQPSYRRFKVPGMQ